MAITGISVVQDNKIDECELLAVHNPLCFIVEVDYTSTAPDELYVDLTRESLTFSCLLESDPQAGKRRFMFIADEIVRGLMGGLDDEVQGDSTNSVRADMTKQIVLLFRDPTIDMLYLTELNAVFLAFTATRASRQFGESPSLNALEDNNEENYIGVVGEPCYCYFYNDNASNVITVTEV